MLAFPLFIDSFFQQDQEWDSFLDHFYQSIEAIQADSFGSSQEAL